MFITVEGVHGAGKSTIARLLHIKLIENNIEAIVTNDQSGTPVGKDIRRVNLETDHKVAPLTETLLFAAAKHQNVVDIIKPNLARGHVVICERFIDAFFVFQGYVRGISNDTLECLHKAATEDLMPDITILLDVDPLIALSRIGEGTKHRLEREMIEYHLKLREGYLKRAETYPDRIRIFNASNSVDSVIQSIWNTLHIIDGRRHIIDGDNLED